MKKLLPVLFLISIITYAQGQNTIKVSKPASTIQINGQSDSIAIVNTDSTLFNIVTNNFDTTGVEGIKVHYVHGKRPYVSKVYNKSLLNDTIPFNMYRLFNIPNTAVYVGIKYYDREIKYEEYQKFNLIVPSMGD